jgi:hypothetical protein
MPSGETGLRHAARAEIRGGAVACGYAARGGKRVKGKKGIGSESPRGTETDAAVLVVRIEPVPEGRTAVPRGVVPGAAAKHNGPATAATDAPRCCEEDTIALGAETLTAATPRPEWPRRRSAATPRKGGGWEGIGKGQEGNREEDHGRVLAARKPTPLPW